MQPPLKRPNADTPTKNPALKLRRTAALAVLVFSLVLAWFGFGRYFLSLLLYEVPSLSFHWNNFSLPAIALGSPTQSATLVIDKVKVETPIVRDVPIDDQNAYDNALETGVALARGSAPLEAPSGNSFIFGHSSKFTFQPTPYDTVFALIPKLQNDDTFQIVSGGQTAVYKVVLSKSIAPTDVQYLAPSQQREVTLVTCWPAGTNFRRWVVQGVKLN